MNDKQKAIIDMLVRLEYALNDTLTEALEEGLTIKVELGMPRAIHLYVAVDDGTAVVPDSVR